MDAANEFIAASEPWALARKPEASGHAGSGPVDRGGSCCAWPPSCSRRSCPASCEEILRRIGAPVVKAGDLRIDRDAVLLREGQRVTQRRDAMWPRLEPKSEASSILDKEQRVSDQPKPDAGTPVVPAPPAVPAPAPAPAAGQPAAAPSAVDNRISIDEFLKIDLRVARVTAAERVPGSKKLVKLSIDVGTEQRTVVAGIAEAYEADALVGRHVAIVANLKPAKLMGIESNGMVLAASPDGGKPILVAFDVPPAPGTRVR